MCQDYISAVPYKINRISESPHTFMECSWGEEINRYAADKEFAAQISVDTTNS